MHAYHFSVLFTITVELFSCSGSKWCQYFVMGLISRLFDTNRASKMDFAITVQLFFHVVGVNSANISLWGSGRPRQSTT